MDLMGINGASGTQLVTPYRPKIKVQMNNGELVDLDRSDLIKYISEMKLVETSELVRQMYDRYQVAVKLSRSDDDGDQGL